MNDVSGFDRDFVGTITFRNEEIALPDGSKMALGIDGAHWVLVYQEKIGQPFHIMECDWREKKLFLDKKPGREDDLKKFKQLLKYFLAEAGVDDLVTILPPSAV